MKCWGKMSLSGAAMLSALLASTAQAGVKDGVDAWQVKNYAKAVAEWRKPAENGDADAQFNLAQAYKLGRGVPTDQKLAQSWYQKAAQQGHEQAQANLGLILFQNGDRQGAMPWITKAADQGEPRAQYVLGTALFNGDLAPKDWPRAYALMTRASAAGLPQAASSLSQMDQYIPLGQRQQGIEMAKDMEKAPQLASATPSSGTSSAPVSPAIQRQRPVATPTPRPVTQPPAKPVSVAAAAPARPAPPPPLAASATTPGGKWRVQLGAVPSMKAASDQWGRLKSKPGLGGLQPFFIDMGKFARIQAGPFATRNDAQQVCNALKPSGQACFPVNP